MSFRPCGLQWNPHGVAAKGLGPLPLCAPWSIRLSDLEKPTRSGGFILVDFASFCFILLYNVNPGFINYGLLRRVFPKKWSFDIIWYFSMVLRNSTAVWGLLIQGPVEAAEAGRWCCHVHHSHGPRSHGTEAGGDTSISAVCNRQWDEHIHFI